MSAQILTFPHFEFEPKKRPLPLVHALMSRLEAYDAIRHLQHLSDRNLADIGPERRHIRDAVLGRPWKP